MSAKKKKKNTTKRKVDHTTKQAKKQKQIDVWVVKKKKTTPAGGILSRGKVRTGGDVIGVCACVFGGVCAGVSYIRLLVYTLCMGLFLGVHVRLYLL